VLKSVLALCEGSLLVHIIPMDASHKRGDLLKSLVRRKVEFKMKYISMKLGSTYQFKLLELLSQHRS